MSATRKPRYCKHGADVRLYICPECANEQMAKRQQKADRQYTNARLRIAAGYRRPAEWR